MYTMGHRPHWINHICLRCSLRKAIEYEDKLSNLVEYCCKRLWQLLQDSRISIHIVGRLWWGGGERSSSTNEPPSHSLSFLIHIQLCHVDTLFYKMCREVGNKSKWFCNISHVLLVNRHHYTDVAPLDIHLFIFFFLSVHAVPRMARVSKTLDRDFCDPS